MEYENTVRIGTSEFSASPFPDLDKAPTSALTTLSLSALVLVATVSLVSSPMLFYPA
jgi:hypothetical protein